MTQLADGDEHAAEKGVDGRWFIAGLACLMVVVAAYFVLGMPGMDHTTASTGGSMAGMNGSATAVGYEEFVRRTMLPETVVINVHDSDDIRIEGTDLFIPYDRIGSDERLPTDRSTEILLYCKTGRMSEQAAATLTRSGYHTVVQLRGGTDASPPPG